MYVLIQRNFIYPPQPINVTPIKHVGFFLTKLYSHVLN